MTNIVDDLLASSIVDDSNQKDKKIEELPNNKKQENAFINTVAPIDKKEEVKNITPISSYKQPEVSGDKYNSENIQKNNDSFKNKVVDLSGAFDAVIEKKKQLSHENRLDKKTNKKKTKFLYIFIVIIIWIIIAVIAVSVIVNNQKESKQREKAIQELQLKIQQRAKTSIK